MTIYQFQNIQRMDWYFYNKWNVKTVLQLKPLSTLQMINNSHRRGLHNQNSIISFETFLCQQTKLACRLRERNLLQIDVRVCHYQIRRNVLKTFLGQIVPRSPATKSMVSVRDLFKKKTHQIGGFFYQLSSAKFEILNFHHDCSLCTFKGNL